MIERRAFLCWLVSGAAAIPLRGLRLHAQAAALPAASVSTLRALAPAVLPSELRAAGHDKVVTDFVQWLASYRHGSERNWGYGHPRKSGTAPIDVSRYATQLRDIDERARARGGALDSLPLDVRRLIVTDALDAAAIRDLPGSPDGQHVITDVMSFFFNSSAATDLLYRARIAPVTCRGLSGAAARPVPMTAGD